MTEFVILEMNVVVIIEKVRGIIFVIQLRMSIGLTYLACSSPAKNLCSLSRNHGSPDFSH